MQGLNVNKSDKWWPPNTISQHLDLEPLIWSTKMVESNVTYELFKTFKFGALQPERFQPMREEEKIRTNHL
jgi:hypothetical protein